MERENWERVGGRRAVEGNRLKWRMEESEMVEGVDGRKQWERDEGGEQSEREMGRGNREGK